MRVVDLTGRQFGRLRVLGRGKSTKAGLYWTCKCSCGTVLDVFGGSLRYGKTKSCGCNMAPLKHGHARRGSKRTKTYNVWATMLSRCRRPNDPAYPRYGGRGISVCERWLKYENFITDMGEAPARTYLDRRGNDGNYEPSNCNWVYPTQSARNTSRNVWLTHRGMTLCLTDWAKLTGVSRDTLNGRYNSGWEIGRLLDTPVAKRKLRR